MRTLAIGDIHGCSRALDALLATVAPKPDDLIITLGDYVNRGPDSAGVLDCLVRLYATGRLVPILGNHEQLMLESLEDDAKLADFLHVGGRRTLACYSRAATLADVPHAHWRFLEHDCRDGHEDGHTPVRQRQSLPRRPAGRSTRVHAAVGALP